MTARDTLTRAASSEGETFPGSALPPIACFTELRHHIDPQAGWTPEIAALSPEEWTAVQHRVTDILRSN